MKMADSNQAEQPQLLNFWGKRATSFVWKYFGFEADENGRYKNHNYTICRVCYHSMKYVGNTTNLAQHLRHHGIGPKNDIAVPKTPPDSPHIVMQVQEEPPTKMPRNDVTMVEHWSKSKRSIVWDYFGFYASADGQYLDKSETICRLCQSTMRYNGNTTNLANHLSRHHGIEGILTAHDPELAQGASPDCIDRVNKILQAAAEVQQREREYNMDLSGSISLSPGIQLGTGSPNSELLGTATIYTATSDHVTTTTSDVSVRRRMSSFGGDRLNISTDRLRAITNALSKYFIAELLPVSYISNEHLVNLMNTLEPMYRMPSSDYFKNTIFQRCLEETKTKLEVEGFWEAPQHTVMLHRWPNSCTQLKSKPKKDIFTVIALYITEDFNLRSKVIQTVFEDVSDADLENIQESWRLRGPVLVRPMPAAESSMPVLACFETTVSSAISKSLQQNELKDLIKPSLKSVLDLRSGDSERFSGISLEVRLDLANGCFQSKYWGLVSRLLEIYISEPKLQQTGDNASNEISTITELVNILKSFQTALDMLKSLRNGTASLILPTLFKLMNRQLGNTPTDSTTVSKMKEELKQSLESVYNDHSTKQLLYSATVIDPRLKSLDWMDAEGKEDAYKSLHTEAIRSLTSFEHLLNIKMEPGEGSERCSTEKANSETFEDDLSFLADVLSGSEDGPNKLTPDEQVREEIQRYRNEQDAKGGTCALSWWSMRTENYPILSHVARRLLCIPATCSPPVSLKYMTNVTDETPIDEISLAMVLHHN